MQEIVHNINLNLSQPNAFEYLFCVQGDHDAEKVIATLYDRNKLYEIDTNCKAMLQGSTESGGLILQNNLTISEDRHKVEFLITKEMSSCSGKVTYNIVLSSSDGAKKSTFPFIIKNTADITGCTPVSVLTTISDYVDRAEKAAKDSETNKKTTDDNVVKATEQATVATTKATESANSAKEATKQANIALTKAEESANSAQKSKDQADIATTKAQEASSSATDSANSASKSAMSASNAKTSETNAEKSATASASSASASADSATISAEKAKASSDSATAAALSEKNAKDSETASKTSETNAKTSEKNASVSAATATEQAKVSSDSATASANSATQSEESATTATIKASEASVSAKNAKASEMNAGQYEKNAKESADLASLSATNASASETNAQSSATDSSKSAKESSTSEANAKQYATNAKVSEDSANTSANSASSSAATSVEQAEVATSKATESAKSASDSLAYSNKAKEYMDKCSQIVQGIEGALIPMGTITFEELPTSNMDTGHMYNISDDFTSDDRFKDGAGKSYTSGTNVYYTKDGKWDVLVGDLAKYAFKIDLESHKTDKANPHKVTKDQIGLGEVGNFKAVSTVAEQGLTAVEKTNARVNIGAGTSSFDGKYDSLSNKPTIPTKTSQLANDSNWQPIRYLTSVEYQNLSSAEKNNGTLYYVTDEDNTFVIDSALNPDSTNLVENKAIYAAVNTKVDKVDGKGLSTNDFTTEEKAKLANIDDEATATTVDSTLSDTSTNPVQNKVAKAELDKKAPTANPVFTGSISMGREDNTTVGSNSVAAGDAVMATGVASHAEGIKTIAASDYQHVQGKYNVEDTENKYAHIVGGGSDGDNRKNIHTIDWDGNGYYAGNMDAKNTTVNLLNPTLQTTTVNSVTCTNNGDGTYTLNGTASADTWFAIINNTENTNLLGNYALAGAPNGFSRNLAIYFRERNDNTNVNSIRNGKIINVLNYYKYYACYIICYSGESMNNVTFKPMLTTNLNATYDDFAPYTGDSGSLNGDVADLKSELSTKFQVLTQAQYNALSDEQKNNGTIYLVD